MFRIITHKRTQTGFSIVELMVGTVVAMLAILVIFNAFAMFEGQKRSTTTTNDVQATGMIALQSIERDVRMAGYGMTVSNQIITSQFACTSMNIYQAGALATVPFMPVRIADGGTGSDSITALYATSPFAATPGMLAAAVGTSSLDPAVSNTAGNVAYNVNDYVLLAQPQVTGRPCSRLRVTGTTNLGASITIQHATSDPANPPSSTNIYPAASAPYPAGYDYSAESPTVVINMGAMPQAQYAVSSTSNSLTYQDLTAGTAAVNLANGVVALKAQYGISAAGTQPVTQWVDATGATWGTTAACVTNWVPATCTPTAADILRIKAVRVAVVARSSLLEKDNVTGTCINNAGTNNGPCAWTDTVASPAPLIDLSADTNWQRYRYRVFETIIPLRNVIWANL